MDDEADPSPYRPLSRLFWNEFFLAPEMIEEWDSCEPARRLGDAAGTQSRREALRATDAVDYQAVMALKRPVFEKMARCFFDQGDGARRRDYDDYVRDNPFVRDYAAFRAAEEGSGPTGGAGGKLGLAGGTRRNPGPAEWPGRAWSRAAQQYHLYCQWQMDRQLAALSGEGRPGLLFDLPLGVHPDGFDVKRWPGLFATGVSTGAPPDLFFASGQDWSTPPLDPQTDRRDGYSYFRACLRTLMRPASVLRIDHMMSFHRLFWIPEGVGPKDGAYVTYPAEELYAVLSRESHRQKTAVVGEDLGTVSNGVRASMRRHAVARTWVFLGSLRPRARTVAPEVPPGALVTLETHDMVPLAGFVHGDDIDTRVETGQLDPAGARREKAERHRLVDRLARLFCNAELGGVEAGGVEARAADEDRARSWAIFSGCLAYLAKSPAKTVLVNLEDLLLERMPQNVPGTGTERPNWRRKIATRLEELPRPKG